jgi:hypothetical protein
MRRILLTTWAVAAGCNFESGGTTAGATDSAATGDTDATTSTSAAETTSTTAPAPDVSTGSTTEMAVSYCHGFQAAAMPFLSLYILGGEPLVDGSSWPIECDGDGTWMFGLYPSLGGWDPMTNEVMFTVEVDVDGFNLDSAGHFFSAEVDYHIGCEDPFAGLLGVAPVSLPTDVTDPTQLDGKPATVRVTVLAGDMELQVDASVTLSAPPDVVLQGCEASP